MSDFLDSILGTRPSAKPSRGLREGETIIPNSATRIELGLDRSPRNNREAPASEGGVESLIPTSFALVAPDATPQTEAPLSPSQIPAAAPRPAQPGATEHASSPPPEEDPVVNAITSDRATVTDAVSTTLQSMLQGNPAIRSVMEGSPNLRALLGEAEPPSAHHAQATAATQSILEGASPVAAALIPGRGMPEHTSRPADLGAFRKYIR